jgi:hypothetical protein
MSKFGKFNLVKLLKRASSWTFWEKKQKKHLDKKWKIATIEILKFQVFEQPSKLQVFADLDQDVILLHFLGIFCEFIIACTWVTWEKNYPKKNLKWMNNGWSNLTIQSVSRIFFKKSFLFHPLGVNKREKQFGPLRNQRGSLCSQV